MSARELTASAALPFVVSAARSAAAAGDREAAEKAQAFAARLWRNLDAGAELRPGEKRIGKAELRRELVRVVGRG